VVIPDSVIFFSFMLNYMLNIVKSGDESNVVVLTLASLFSLSIEDKDKLAERMNAFTRIPFQSTSDYIWYMIAYRYIMRLASLHFTYY